MPSIVLYRDDEAPVNDYPARIVSPTRPGPCCRSAMVPLGEPWAEGRAWLQYRRCTGCGYTVRRVLRTTPDPAILRSARQAFQSLFGGRAGGGPEVPPPLADGRAGGVGAPPEAPAVPPPSGP